MPLVHLAHCLFNIAHRYEVLISKIIWPQHETVQKMCVFVHEMASLEPQTQWSSRRCSSHTIRAILILFWILLKMIQFFSQIFSSFLSSFSWSMENIWEFFPLKGEAWVFIFSFSSRKTTIGITKTLIAATHAYSIRSNLMTFYFCFVLPCAFCCAVKKTQLIYFGNRLILNPYGVIKK